MKETTTVLFVKNMDARKIKTIQKTNGTIYNTSTDIEEAIAISYLEHLANEGIEIDREQLAYQVDKISKALKRQRRNLLKAD